MFRIASVFLAAVCLFVASVHWWSIQITMKTKSSQHSIIIHVYQRDDISEGDIRLHQRPSWHGGLFTV